MAPRPSRGGRSLCRRRLRVVNAHAPVEGLLLQAPDLSLEYLHSLFSHKVVLLVLLQLSAELPQLVAAGDLVELPLLVHLLATGAKGHGLVCQHPLRRAQHEGVRHPGLVAPALEHFEVGEPEAVVLELHLHVLGGLLPGAVILRAVALGLLDLVPLRVDSGEGLAQLYAAKLRLHGLAPEQRHVRRGQGREVVPRFEVLHLLIDEALDLLGNLSMAELGVNVRQRIHQAVVFILCEQELLATGRHGEQRHGSARCPTLSPASPKP
mmetsp:Transcript_18999/g.43134  ORF Transcript_18999/g.43134 Transcript_18999/m.43134 type:complete len:266 (+) Transcript_18999:85-882(+)